VAANLERVVPSEPREGPTFANITLTHSNNSDLPRSDLGGFGAKEIKALEEIKKCRDIMKIKGSSAKMILEHLALTLP